MENKIYLVKKLNINKFIKNIKTQLIMKEA